MSKRHIYKMSKGRNDFGWNIQTPNRRMVKCQKVEITLDRKVQRSKWHKIGKSKVRNWIGTKYSKGQIDFLWKLDRRVPRLTWLIEKSLKAEITKKWKIGMSKYHKSSKWHKREKSKVLNDIGTNCPKSSNWFSAKGSKV